MCKPFKRILRKLSWISIFAIISLACAHPNDESRGYIPILPGESPKISGRYTLDNKPLVQMDKHDVAARIQGFFYSENGSIPVGNYTGKTNFSSTLENDIDDSYLPPICTENSVEVTIESDGTAHGEISSICYAKQNTDNEEMQQTHHSEVTGVIEGKLLDTTGQLSIAYTWHSYFTSPQWETTSLDETVDFVYTYHVQVSGNVMTLTPAAEVEDYYKLELTKQSGPEGSEEADGTSSSTTTDDSSEDLPEWVKNGQAYIDDGIAVYVPEWLEWIKPKQTIRNNGTVIEPDGNIWVYSRVFQKWKGPIRSKTPLYTGDRVATHNNSSCRIVFRNPEGNHDTIVVGSDTLLEVPTLPGEDEKSDYPTLWTIYKGMVKIKSALFKELPVRVGGIPFVVRTPTIVVGTRGTEFVVMHNPEAQTTSIHLVSGELDYYNLAAAGPDDAVLTAGQKLIVMEDGTETIEPLDQAELESILAANNLGEIEPLNDEEIEQLFSENLDGQSSDANKNDAGKLIIFSAIICAITVIGLGAVIAILLFMSRKNG